MVYRRILLVFGALLACSQCLADVTLVHDDFDAAALSEDWVVHLDLDPPAAGWTYEVAAGSLTVTDVQPDSVETWSAVRLRQECSAAAGFSLECSFSWDTTSEPETNHAMQKLGVSLLNAAGGSIASALYYDCWFASRGTWFASVASETQQDPPSSLPHEGTVIVRIERVAGTVSVYWDTQLVISGAEASAVASVELSFWYYWHASGSFFGTDSVDWLTVMAPDTAVEPASWTAIKALYR